MKRVPGGTDFAESKKTDKKIKYNQNMCSYKIILFSKSRSGDIMVECQGCGFDNEEGIKFCIDCGEKMEVNACPECGAVNDPDDMFCEKCGAKLGLDKEEPPEVDFEEEEAPPLEEKPPSEEKKPPVEKPKEEKVTVVKMIYAQNDATKIANKNLATDGKKIFSKKIEVVEAALLRYLPLVQASFEVEKKKLFGLAGKEKDVESLYFHGLTGKLLQVTDTVAFSDITQAKAENIKDFDGVAQFETLSKIMLPKGTEKPKIGEKYISKKLRKLFGATLKGTKTVYLPLFKFKITNTKTKRSRILYVDSIFGIASDKNPFK